MLMPAGDIENLLMSTPSDKISPDLIRSQSNIISAATTDVENDSFRLFRYRFQASHVGAECIFISLRLVDYFFHEFSVVCCRIGNVLGG